MKILLAEPDSGLRTQLTTALSQAGHDVVALAEDGAVTDSLLGPGPPGLAVISSFFSLPHQVLEFPSPPYLIVLAREGERPALADDYLVGAFDTDHLLERVSLGCRIVEMQRQLADLDLAAADTEYQAKYDGLVNMLDSLDAVIYAADMQTHEMLFMNAAAKVIATGDVGHKCWQVVQSGQSGPCDFCTNDKLLDEDGNPAAPYVWEFQNTIDNNWYQCRDQAIRWMDGRLVRLEVATNITDRVRVEEALRQSEKDLRSITDASFEAVFISENAVCLDQNLTAEKMFGYTKEEAIGRSASEWIVPEDRALVLKNIMEGYEQPYEVTALRKDGSTFCAEIQGRMINYQGKQIRMTALRDITERKQAEEALRQSEVDLRSISDAAFEAIFLTDQGKCLGQNRTAEQMFGYSLDEALGSDARTLFIEEDRELIMNNIRSGYELPYEVTALRKDGSTFPAEVQGRVITYRGKPVRMTALRDISERKKAEEKIREQQERFKAFFSSVNDVVLVHPLLKEGFGPFIEVNDTACERYGYSREDFKRMTIRDLNEKMVIEPDAAGAVRKKLVEEKKLVIESVHVKKSGEKFPVEVSATVIDLGNKPVILSVIRDISERKRAEKEAREQEERFKAFFSAVNDAIFVHPLLEEGFAPFVEVNDTACRHYGYSREEFLQMTAQDITKTMVVEQHATGRHRQTLLEAKKMVFEAIHIKKSGEEFPVEISANIVEQHGKPIIIAVVRDITERKKAEKQIEHMAFYDALTDLPNRALFVEQLRIALQNYQRDKKPFAVHMLDLDHFKDVNDSLGHPLGDALLTAVADRIRAVVRSSDIFARLGGDEFVLIQTQYHDLTDVSNLAEKIIEEISRDFEVEGHTIWINVSIGIVVNDKTGNSVDDLLSQVDSALYKAKAAGRGTYAYYEDAMTLSLQRELQLTRELSCAVERQELLVEYQPQINLVDGRMVGVEALMRWKHPKRGKLFPGDFIPIAEKRGLIRELSGWVMEEACRQSRNWTDQGLSFGRIAVNLSAQQVTHKNFEKDVRKIISETGTDPRTLEFEFTETMLIDATEQIMENIKSLSRFGISFAIDDFGTGFSSLSYLRKFATDKIKIDREFVKDILDDPGAERIVSATITLGKNLGLKIIAEGVEFGEQAEALKKHGCEMAQGFLYGRSMPPEEIEARWLRK